jgi:hypothetical protein
MRSLLFCRDGVLRARDGIYDRAAKRHYPLLLPVTELYGEAGILPVLNATVEFEDGIDVRETLLNLEPFAEQVSRICHCRFDRFLAEVRKPIDLENRREALAEFAFTHFLTVGAVPEFERDGEGSFADTMFERVPGSRLYSMREVKHVVTDRLDLEQRWSGAAYKAGTVDLYDAGEDNGYSTHLSRLSTWHDLKIRVADKSILVDETVSSDFLSHEEGLFDATHPMAKETTNADGSRVFRRTVMVDAPHPTLHSLVLMCLVWDIGFHGDPEETSAFAESLSEKAAEADRQMDFHAAVESGELTEERIAEIDAEIEADLERERAAEAEELRRNPFSDEDIGTLAFALEIRERDADAVMAPDGWPESIGEVDETEVPGAEDAR